MYESKQTDGDDLVEGLLPIFLFVVLYLFIRLCGLGFFGTLWITSVTYYALYFIYKRLTE